jgi:PKD repeat protein
MPTSPKVGENVVFTATVAGGTAPYTYAWNFGDSMAGTGSSTSHTYSSAGTFTVRLTITDSTSPTAQSKTIEHTVPVTAVPPFTADFTFSPTSPRTGESVGFTAATTGGTAPFSYSWNFGDTMTGTGKTVTHIFTIARTFTVMLTVTDATGKTATASHMITVSSQPVGGTFTLTASNTNVTLEQDSSAKVKITVESNGFVGTVTLTVKISPSGDDSPGLRLKPSQVILKSSGNMMSTLTITAGEDTAPGIYTIIVTGTGLDQSHSVKITLTVTAQVDGSVQHGEGSWHNSSWHYSWGTCCSSDDRESRLSGENGTCNNVDPGSVHKSHWSHDDRNMDTGIKPQAMGSKSGLGP